MREAREEVREVLRMVSESHGGRELVSDAIDAGFIAPCQDARREGGWLPTTVARRLADRVLSLIAVDYLDAAAE